MDQAQQQASSRCFLKKNKTSQRRGDENASFSRTTSKTSEQTQPSPTPPRPVIFAAVVKVRRAKGNENNPAFLFGQASSYWIGEQKDWETTRQKMGIQLISDLPADGEAEVVFAYSTNWRGDLPKNSLPVQKALKEKIPEEPKIYRLPRECNILSYGFQKG